MLPLKEKDKYFPLRLFGLPFSFKNEEATEFEAKTGTVFKPDEMQHHLTNETMSFSKLIPFC